jgi:hypothetical protein
MRRVALRVALTLLGAVAALGSGCANDTASIVTGSLANATAAPPSGVANGEPLARRSGVRHRCSDGASRTCFGSNWRPQGSCGAGVRGQESRRLSTLLAAPGPAALPMAPIRIRHQETAFRHPHLVGSTRSRARRPTPLNSCRRPCEDLIRLHWCGREDSNLHALRRQPLKLVRLPIPPRPHAMGASTSSKLRRPEQAADATAAGGRVNPPSSDARLAKRRANCHVEARRTASPPAALD